jgi:hypothetical protein
VLNPYASFLGDRKPLEVIEQTPDRLAAVTAPLSAADLEWRRAPGKWNAREILCHLADCEIAFAFRLRQALAEEHHVIQPFDQDRWARAYDAFDATGALDVFSILRRWNVTLVRPLTADVLARKLVHPERGEMTVQTVLETMAGHDLNHLAQLERAARR